MFSNLFSKAMTMPLGDQTITFHSLADFEFGLGGRTEVPTRRLTQLVHMSVDELKEEAKNIKTTERKFVKILSQSIEVPGTITKALKDLDVQIFSQDHQWRDIMSWLAGRDQEYEDLKKMAMVRYMGYLTSRQEAIKVAYMTKRAVTPTESAADETASPPAADAPAPGGSMETVQLPASPLQAVASAESEPADATPASELETIEAPIADDSPYSRIAKGEAVVLPLHKGGMLEMILSKHHFKLFAHQDKLELVDELGGSFPLQDGKNIVGRDSVCNVVVDADFRDISRLHVIVERLGDQAVRLTDLSSQGTFIPSKIMRQAG